MATAGLPKERCNEAQSRKSRKLKKQADNNKQPDNAPLHVLQFNEVEAPQLARCLLSTDLDRAVGLQVKAVVPNNENTISNNIYKCWPTGKAEARSCRVARQFWQHE